MSTTITTVSPDNDANYDRANELFIRLGRLNNDILALEAKAGAVPRPSRFTAGPTEPNYSRMSDSDAHVARQKYEEALHAYEDALPEENREYTKIQQGFNDKINRLRSETDQIEDQLNSLGYTSNHGTQLTKFKDYGTVKQASPVTRLTSDTADNEKMSAYYKTLVREQELAEQALAADPDNEDLRKELNSINRRMLHAKQGTGQAQIEAQRWDVYTHERLKDYVNKSLRETLKRETEHGKELKRNAREAGIFEAEISPDTAYTYPILSEFVKTGKRYADIGFKGGFTFDKSLITGIKDAKEGKDSPWAKQANRIHDYLLNKNEKTQSEVEKEFLKFWEDPDRKYTDSDSMKRAKDQIAANKQKIKDNAKPFQDEAKRSLKVSRDFLKKLESIENKGVRKTSFEPGTDAFGNKVIGMKVSGGGVSYRVFLKPVKGDDGKTYLRAYEARPRNASADVHGKSENWVKDYVAASELTEGHLGGKGYIADDNNPLDDAEAIEHWRTALEGVTGKLRTSRKDAWQYRTALEAEDLSKKVEASFNNKTLSEIVDDIKAKPENKRTPWESKFLNRTKANRLTMLNDLGAVVSTDATGNKVLFNREGNELPEDFEPYEFLDTSTKHELDEYARGERAAEHWQMAKEGKNGWHFETHKDPATGEEKQYAVKELKEDGKRILFGKDGMVITLTTDPKTGKVKSRKITQTGAAKDVWSVDEKERKIQEQKAREHEARQLADYTKNPGEYSEAQRANRVKSASKKAKDAAVDSEKSIEAKRKKDTEKKLDKKFKFDQSVLDALLGE